MKNIKHQILLRLWVCFGAITLLGISIIYKAVKTQVSEGVYWRKMAESISTKYANIEPIRGNIYACDGALLATSIPIYEVRMDLHKSTIPNDTFNKYVEPLASSLANYFKDNSKQEYLTALKRGRENDNRYFLVRRKVNHNVLKDLKKFPLLKLGRFKGGLIVEQNSKRILPFALAERTIGWKTKKVSTVGFEAAYDNYLIGKVGKRLMQKVSGGNWIPINDDNEKDPKDGMDIYTHLDVNIQDAATNALKSGLIKNNAHHGCVIVMEVKTGAIKAIANLQRLKDSSYAEWRNYAIAEANDPGSTFKIVSAMALLDLTSTTPETKVNTEDGTHDFYGELMKDSHKGGYGVITLQNAFAQSSNVAISKLVEQNFRKDPERFTDYIARLKLTQKIGLDISGEPMPKVSTLGSKSWSNLSLPWTSVGYELRLTPLQMLTVYNAIANDGVMVKPQFLSEVKDAGKVIKTVNSEIMVREVCKPSTLKKVRNMLEGVVQYGTATNLRNNIYTIAGKTGTAKINIKENGRMKETYRASFAGYFPAESPKYSMIVVIEDPSKGEYYGSAVSGPVFKEIADKIYARTTPIKNYLSLFSPDNSKLPNSGVLSVEEAEKLMGFQKYKTELLDSIQGFVSFEKGKNGIVIEKRKMNKKYIPDMKGMALIDAIYMLENIGIKVNIKGKGRIAWQSVEAGREAKTVKQIELKLN